jgi:VRR-NUC domain
MPTEDAEQVNLAKWLDAHKLKWCHVPNGGHRDKITGARLKAAGVKKGVPDILIFDHPPLHPGKIGVALEVKRSDGGVLSPHQEEWLEALAARGWLTAVCNGWEAAVKLLREAGFTVRLIKPQVKI